MALEEKEIVKENRDNNIYTSSRGKYHGIRHYGGHKINDTLWAYYPILFTI